MVKKINLLFLLFLFVWGCQQADPVIRIAEFKDDKKAALSFTFDDTNQSGIDAIAPLFDERDLKATFAINCSDTYEGWKDLAAKGHEIGNHSCNHLNLTAIQDTATLENEINYNYDRIAENIGIPPVTFVHPYDATNSTVDTVVFQRHLFTRVSPKGFCKPKPYGNAPLAEIFIAIARHEWLVLAGHGLGDGCCRVDYDQFVDVLNYVKGNEQNIWIDTFRNVALYKLERENAVLAQEAAGNELHLSLKLNLNITLPYQITWVPLTVVVPLHGAVQNFRVVHAGSAGQGNIPFVRSSGALRFDILPDEDVVIIFDENNAAPLPFRR